MKASKYYFPLVVGLLVGSILAQPGYAVVATGTGGGTTLTDSASLRSALSDETGTGAAVFATSPTLVTPILGTPTSGTLTNCTLPVGGVTGLGTGVGTWLATPSSANLASAVTDETGSGLAVFATSPTITTPAISGLATITQGTANAGVLASTGYSLTGSNATNMIDLAGTWNTSGSPTLIKANVTNTNSGSTSKMLDLQRGGTTVVSVDKYSNLVLRNIDNPTMSLSWYGSDRVGSLVFNGNTLQMAGAYQSMVDTSPTFARLGAYSSNGATIYWLLYEEGQGVASFRNGTTSSVSLNLYNTYTSGSSYERVANTWGSNNVHYHGCETVGGTKRMHCEFGAAEKTLTDATATAFVQVPVASGDVVGGQVVYEIYVTNGTDYQIIDGSFNFSAANKAGTETVNIGTVVNESKVTTSGTLTVTFDADTSPTNAINLRANADTSLTPTTFVIRYRVNLTGPRVALAPQ